MRQSTVLLVILNKICVFLSTMQIRILELSLTQIIRKNSCNFL